MLLFAAFGKFLGFRILEYFIQSPRQETHLKELSRRLRISPRSVKIYCDLLEKDGVLLSERKGNLRIFSLNNEDFAVKELKSAYYALFLKEMGIEKLCSNCSSLAVYGSFASGDFDEKSDLDILAIGGKGDIDYALLHKIEEKVGKRIQLTVMPFYEWQKMKKAGNGFAGNVIGKHMLAKGVPL
jgi:predicted nucleotidyltransferase